MKTEIEVTESDDSYQHCCSGNLHIPAALANSRFLEKTGWNSFKPSCGSTTISNKLFISDIKIQGKDYKSLCYVDAKFFSNAQHIYDITIWPYWTTQAWWER